MSRIYLFGKKPDALTRRALADLKRFTDWCAAGGVTGHIGEISWPSLKPDASNPDAGLWEGIGRRWYVAADTAGLWVSQWAASRSQNPYYVLLSYGNASVGNRTVINTGTGKAGTIAAHPETAQYRRGVNLMGAMENATGNLLVDGTTHYGAPSNLGTHNTDYWWPVTGDWTYLAARGVKTVRLCFAWERMQPTIGGALDSAQVTLLTNALADAYASGIGVILCPFGNAWYWTGGGGSTATQAIMTTAGKAGAFNGNHLADFWQRVIAAISGNANNYSAVVGFDLVNEPRSLVAETGTFTANGATINTFDTTAEGWVDNASVAAVTRDASLAYAGAGSDTFTPTFGGAGASQWFRDAVQSNRDYSARGDTFGIAVYVPSGVAGAGQWQAKVTIHVNGFNATDGSQGYQNITPGQWNLIVGTFSTGNMQQVYTIGAKVKNLNALNTAAKVNWDNVQVGSVTANLSAQRVWEEITKTAYTGIRQVEPTKYIFVEGYPLNLNHGCGAFPDAHPGGPWIPGATNLLYSAHHYFDALSFFGGTYTSSYAAEGAAAQAAGY